MIAVSCSRWSCASGLATSRSPARSRDVCGIAHRSSSGPPSRTMESMRLSDPEGVIEGLLAGPDEGCAARRFVTDSPSTGNRSRLHANCSTRDDPVLRQYVVDALVDHPHHRAQRGHDRAVGRRSDPIRYSRGSAPGRPRTGRHDRPAAREQDADIARKSGCRRSDAPP